MNECVVFGKLVIASGMLWMFLAIGCGVAIYRLNVRLTEMTEDRDWWMKHSGGPRL